MTLGQGGPWPPAQEGVWWGRRFARSIATPVGNQTELTRVGAGAAESQQITSQPQSLPRHPKPPGYQRARLKTHFTDHRPFSTEKQLCPCTEPYITSRGGLLILGPTQLPRDTPPPPPVLQVETEQSSVKLEVGRSTGSAHRVCLCDEVVTVVEPAQKGSQGLLAGEGSLIRWGAG